jgi:hypothetical protein
MRKLTLISLTILLLSLPLATPTLADGQGEPYIESCDEYGNTKNVFGPNEPVYVTGRLNKPDADYKIYIISHYDNWEPGTTKLDDLRNEGYEIYEVCTVHTDKKGEIGIIRIVPIDDKMAQIRIL